MSDCLFCSIINGDIDASIVYEDEQVIAFRDINPQAPVHCLVIPRRHIETVSDLTDSEEELTGHLVNVARQIAEKEGLKAGYRLVFNCGDQAGQEVMHIHLHLLGGRKLNWPPG
ncbi:MAG: histidine triad nucleotide-binding protein [bacterium]